MTLVVLLCLVLAEAVALWELLVSHNRLAAWAALFTAAFLIPALVAAVHAFG